MRSLHRTRLHLVASPLAHSLIHLLALLRLLIINATATRSVWRCHCHRYGAVFHTVRGCTPPSSDAPLAERAPGTGS